jgi:hypothetical protein
MFPAVSLLSRKTHYSHAYEHLFSEHKLHSFNLSAIFSFGRVCAVNLVLEKEERVAMGDKGRGEVRGEAGEVTGVVADVSTTNGLGKRNGVFGGWQLEKWRYCYWLVGLMWTEVQNSDLSTNMPISRKMKWEGGMV